MAARTRCTNPNYQHYNNYGGRGITFEFKNFEEFRDALYEDYLAHSAKYGKSQTSIERIDNDGPYSLMNCKWATRSEQCLNRRLPSGKNKVSSLAGAHKRKYGWVARKSIDGVQKYLGYFKTEEEAHKAFLKAV